MARFVTANVEENELLARPSTIPTIFTTGSEFSLSLGLVTSDPNCAAYFLVAFFFSFFLALALEGRPYLVAPRESSQDLVHVS
jgi:hypothetical protein